MIDAFDELAPAAFQPQRPDDRRASPIADRLRDSTREEVVRQRPPPIGLPRPDERFGEIGEHVVAQGIVYQGQLGCPFEERHRGLGSAEQ